MTLHPIGGVPPYSFSLASGALPPGLLLGATTGILSGKPASSGLFLGIVFKVTDSVGAVAILQPTSILVAGAFIPEAQGDGGDDNNTSDHLWHDDGVWDDDGVWMD